MEYLPFFVFQFLAIIIGLLAFSALTDNYRLILIQIIISVIVDLLAIYVVRYIKPNNIFVYNIYMPIEFLTLSFSAYLTLNGNKLKHFLLYGITLYCLIALVSFILNGFSNFNTILLILGFILMSSFYLFILISPNIDKSLIRNPFMIIVIGQIIYFLGVTPFWVLRDVLLLINSQFETKLFLLINKNLMMLRYAFCFIAFTFVFIRILFKKTQRIIQ
jgi:hypothetical protein